MTSTEVLCIKTKVGLVVVAVVVVVVVVSSSSNTNMHASTEYASPKMSNNKGPPSMSDGREVEKRTFYLVESKLTVENATVASLPKQQRVSRGINAHRELAGHWSLADLNYLPTSGPMCEAERRMLYTGS